MNENVCPHCLMEIEPPVNFCKYCGGKVAQLHMNEQIVQQNLPYQPQIAYMQQPSAQIGYQTAADPSWPIKSKSTAGILALLLGGIGVHKFYLGHIGIGLIYLLFAWTGIPAIFALIDGIKYLTSSDEDFQLKHHVRLG